jgi:hypothetical protein
MFATFSAASSCPNLVPTTQGPTTVRKRKADDEDVHDNDYDDIGPEATVRKRKTEDDHGDSADDEDFHDNDYDDIGPEATVRKRKHEVPWMARLEEFRDFRSKNVPSAIIPDKRLALWVVEQRRNYKKYTKGRHSPLTNQRVAMLDDVGFVWSMTELFWMTKLQDLREYKRKNGDCHVKHASVEDKQLASWVSNLDMDTNRYFCLYSFMLL